MMMKIITAAVILMEGTAAGKMLTQTFAPFVNALKKKFHCLTVNFYAESPLEVLIFHYDIVYFALCTYVLTRSLLYTFLP